MRNTTQVLFIQKGNNYNSPEIDKCLFWDIQEELSWAVQGELENLEINDAEEKAVKNMLDEMSHIHIVYADEEYVRFKIDRMSFQKEYTYLLGKYNDLLQQRAYVDNYDYWFNHMMTTADIQMMKRYLEITESFGGLMFYLDSTHPVTLLELMNGLYGEEFSIDITHIGQYVENRPNMLSPDDIKPVDLDTIGNKTIFYVHGEAFDMTGEKPYISGMPRQGGFFDVFYKLPNDYILWYGKTHEHWEGNKSLDIEVILKDEDMRERSLYYSLVTAMFD